MTEEKVSLMAFIAFFGAVALALTVGAIGLFQEGKVGTGIFVSVLAIFAGTLVAFDVADLISIIKQSKRSITTLHQGGQHD